MLIPFGIGVVVGIFAVAKLIEILLRRFPGPTYCAIMGLVTASPVAILMGLSYTGLTAAAVIFSVVMLALGSVLAVVLHQALTAVDTRSAQRAMNESFEFVKAQLVRYNSYVSADKAKSLVRLMDKTAEAARILRDEPGAGAQELAARAGRAASARAGADAG